MALFKSKKKKDEPAAAESQLPENPFGEGFDDKPGWMKIDFDSIQKKSRAAEDGPQPEQPAASLTAEEILRQIKEARGDRTAPAAPPEQPDIAPAGPVAKPEEYDSGEEQVAIPTPAAPPEQPDTVPAGPVAKPEEYDSGEERAAIPAPAAPPEQPDTAPAGPVAKPEEYDSGEERAALDAPVFEETGSKLEFEIPVLEQTETQDPESGSTSLNEPDLNPQDNKKGSKNKGKKADSRGKEPSKKAGKVKKQSARSSKKPPRERLFTPDMTMRRRRYMATHLIFASLAGLAGFAASIAIGYYFYYSSIFDMYINIILISLSGCLALCCVYCYIRYIKSLNHEYDMHFKD